MIREILRDGLRHAVLKTIDGGYSESLLQAISIPAERIIDEDALKGQKLHLGHGDVGAGNRVAAGEVYGGTSDVVRPLDIPEGNVGQIDCRSFISARLGEAVVLVDDDTVPDVVHLDVLEGYAGDGAASPLPRLDPNPVVRFPYQCVAHRYVGHACVGVVHA